MAAATAEGRVRTRDVLVLGGPSDFGSLLLSAPVLAGLEAAGFHRPSPVQLKAIPLGRCGLDLIVQAKSGTGKTCVFSTVALDAVLLESSATQVLILAPTREIAVQIHAVITAIGIKMEGLECHVFIGGTPLNQDKSRLKKCHIAVGSPGRIKQLIELDYLNTASIRLFILDEADKLLEEGSFQEQINWIYSSLPANKQMLAVSATYPESLANALTRYMREPMFVRLNPTDLSLIGLKQYYKIVNSHPLPHKTFEEKTQHLQELFSKIPFNQALVFSNLHSRAQHLAEILTRRGFPAEYISGSMNQNQRLDAMAKLKQFHCRVLISTDLTSRGIDAEKVNLVVNLDVPVDWETYMHRIGRAGRFGTLGLSVTYCCRGEEENMMMKIAQKCNLQLLPLPEPIPPGMMDQFEDGEVEVKPVVHSGASVSSDTECLKPEEPALQPVQNTSSEVPLPLSNLPGDNSSVERQKKALKQKQIKCPKSANPEKGSRTPQTPSCHLEQRNGVQAVSRTDGQQNMQAPDEEALKNNLPRILCLSSFKKQQNNPWNFLELVKDYEHFVKQVLEREVEIVRSYSGSGEPCELPRRSSSDLGQQREPHRRSSSDSGQQRELPRRSSSGSGECEFPRYGGVDWKEVGRDTQPVARGGVSSDSDDSDSSRYSSDSGEDSSSSEVLPGTPEKKAVSTPHQGHASFCSTPEKPQELLQVPEQSQVKKKTSKQKAKQKQSHRHRLPTPSSRRAEDDNSNSSWHDGAPSASWGYDGCWRYYSQAWHGYYATVARYRKSYRHFHWLNAYRANSVYLQELLESSD